LKIPHDIEAEIYFLTTEEGGRLGPAFDDYRPQFFYDGHDWDARHLYPDVKQVNPGETVRAYLGFMSPAEHLGKIFVNMPFQIREGARIVGKGKVTKIIELEESAKRAKLHDA
jgi:translation elongation factor EF-Tu-like GTPase